MTQPPQPPPHAGSLPPPPPFPPGAYAPPPPAPRRRRMLPVVVAVVAAVLVVGLAVLVPLVVSADHDAVARGHGDRAQPGPTVDTSDLSEVKEYDDLAVDHLPEGASVDYPQSPPVGGRHAPVWLECGVYDQPVPEANMVHSLEHGTVVVHHVPDLSESDRRLLASKLPDNGIMAPYPGLRAPVVATVWGRQLDLLGADDPRLDLFIEAYGHGETAPEPLASCHGGVRPEDLGGGSTTRIA